MDYKILLTEDDDSIREILTELLREEGYECTPAIDGQEAIEILKRKNFDLLITDFRMPRMDGAQLLKWCRTHEKKFPVIFITANANLLPTENGALGDQSASLLRKPIEINDLMQFIENGRRKTSNLRPA